MKKSKTFLLSPSNSHLLAKQKCRFSKEMNLKPAITFVFTTVSNLKPTFLFGVKFDEYCDKIFA